MPSKRRPMQCSKYPILTRHGPIAFRRYGGIHCCHNPAVPRPIGRARLCAMALGQHCARVPHCCATCNVQARISGRRTPPQRSACVPSRCRMDPAGCDGTSEHDVLAVQHCCAVGSQGMQWPNRRFQIFVSSNSGPIHVYLVPHACTHARVHALQSSSAFEVRAKPIRNYRVLSLWHPS